METKQALEYIHVAYQRYYPGSLCCVCLLVTARNPGIAPSRYDVLFSFVLFWLVGGMFDDLTFYQVHIIGGRMMSRWGVMMITDLPDGSYTSCVHEKNT